MSKSNEIEINLVNQIISCVSHETDLFELFFLCRVTKSVRIENKHKAGDFFHQNHITLAVICSSFIKYLMN